ncbi:MAG TPA: caspase family protein [Thermoanaerobaculia bacterium]
MNVKKEVMATATLPKLKTRLKPLDTKVRVALHLPAPPEQISAYLVTPLSERPVFTRHWYTVDRIKDVPYEAATAEHYQVDLATAFSERLSEIVQQLFPRTTLYREGEVPSSEEIQLRAQATPKLIEGGSTGLEGLQLQISLTVTDAEGHPIAVIEGSSIGVPTKRFYWALKNAWVEMGALALGGAFDGLIRAIPANQTLKHRLDELAKDRALPAGIITTARFHDETAFLPNGRLDAGEEGVLRIQVSNQGPGPAYDVAVRVTSDPPQVALSGAGTVGDLKPGESKEVVLRAAGNLDLPSATAKLRIETAEKRGYGARPVLFELPIGKLVPPQLEIVDVTLNDRPSGQAQGDGDGQPANGETLEAIVRVRNAGPGEAVGVTVAMAAPKGVTEILEAKAVIPRIAVNRVEEARLFFRLPIALQASELPLSFQVVDARGTQAASANKDQTWRIRTKRPGIELAYRLYDGSSTGSTGNRDGIASNGERIEVAVTPTNRGDLPARGVRIAIESADPKLAPRPAVLEIGDLPVHAEGAVQRFTFEVPRAYGMDRSLTDLGFTLSISQQSFPPRQEPLALSFRGLRPQISLETAAPPTLARGTGGELVLRLRNQGTLRAEDVILQVTSEATGVDLLDERGVPVRTRKIAFGALDPQGVVPEQRVRVNVRRNAAIGPSPLRIAVSQKDFPSLAKDTALAVTDEPAVVIAAAPSEEHAPDLPPSSAVPAAPATISFLRNTPGEHLLAEAIVLRFEVQSPTDLAEVRLTQNERLLPIDAARRAAGAAVGGLQVAQYEVPVQLEEGENRFEVVAVTRQGLRSARPLTLFRDPEVGRLWVVAIGISKYQDTTIQSLQYADADARAVFDYFRDTFGLPESQIFLRVNEQATLREIKSVLGTRLAARANDPRDTVILYFAGHGMRERVTGSLDADGLGKYFLPYDADRNDLFSTALDMDEVTNILRRLTPERVVVLLDSCFSGAAGGRSPFDPKADRERALITGEFLDRMAHVGKGRVVMTASGPEESAQESADLGHGLFTYYLLDGLRGAADLSGDGEIDVHEIYRYVSDKVARATKGRQNPKLKEPDLVGRILLGRGAVRGRR